MIEIKQHSVKMNVSLHGILDLICILIIEFRNEGMKITLLEERSSEPLIFSSIGADYITIYTSSKMDK
ncbi:hypothetical protein HZS_5556 [Henneguya salminicola]|nr:hypothetical protein HZS_5556 [Henneguya salminicola]